MLRFRIVLRSFPIALRRFGIPLLCFLIALPGFSTAIRDDRVTIRHAHFQFVTVGVLVARNVTTVLPSPGAVAVKVIFPDGAVDFSIATHRP